MGSGVSESNAVNLDAGKLANLGERLDVPLLYHKEYTLVYW